MLQLVLVLAALAATISKPPPGDSGDDRRVLFLTTTSTAEHGPAVQFVEGGAGAVPAAWPTVDIAWYFVRGEGYQENRDRVAPDKAGETSVGFTPAGSGVTMVGIDFKQTVATLTTGELRTWLRGQGFQLAADSLGKFADERPMRVRWRISAKALSRSNADAAPQPSEIAMSKSGQQAEIRLWADGTLAAAGDDVPLKLYADGDKLASVDVIGWVGGAAIAPLVADPAGVANLTVTAGGECRLAAAGVRLLTDDAAADAEVYIATLTFEIGGKGGAR
ncbi:MAG: hypothetical protein AMXMBFR47_03570 [Planctomycetota bacterium]